MKHRRIPLVLVGLLGALALLTVACGNDDDDSGAVEVTEFEMSSSVDCTDNPTLVPVSWATSGATSVDFLMDGAIVTAMTDQSPNGSGNVSVPCDDLTHAVELVANGEDGSTASSTKEVTTSTGGGGGDNPTPTPGGGENPTPTPGGGDNPTPTPGGDNPTPTPSAAPGPVIESFTLSPPDSVACTAGQEATVQAAWQTSNAQTIAFEVDGQPLTADAGQPTSGTGDIPIPCDNQNHTVTIVATGADDQSVDQSATIATSEQ